MIGNAHDRQIEDTLRHFLTGAEPGAEFTLDMGNVVTTDAEVLEVIEATRRVGTAIGIPVEVERLPAEEPRQAPDQANANVLQAIEQLQERVNAERQNHVRIRKLPDPRT